MRICIVAERGCIDLQLLMDFASHAPTPSAYSPCMHRADAVTVSFSRVSVADGVIEFVYFPAPPCARREKDTESFVSEQMMARNLARLQVSV